MLSRSRPERSRRRRSRGEDAEIRLRHPPRWMKLCGPPRPGVFPAADPVFGGMMVIGAISATLAISGTFAIQLIPLVQREGWLSFPHSPLLAGVAVLLLLAMAYAASFIGQAMTESVETHSHEWQFDIEFDRAVTFSTCGLGGLVGGPILFLAGGLLYWLNCGELTPLDWLILAELWLAGIASWLALACGSAAIGQFALSRPARFGRILRRLGYRGVGLILGASVLLLLHIAVAVLALQQIQNGEPSAVVWLGGCTFSGIIVATLLLSRLSRILVAPRIPCVT